MRNFCLLAVRGEKFNCRLLYGPSLLLFFQSGCDLLGDFLFSLAWILWYENIGGNVLHIWLVWSPAVLRDRWGCSASAQHNNLCEHIFIFALEDFVTELFPPPCPETRAEQSLSLLFYICFLQKDRHPCSWLKISCSDLIAIYLVVWGCSA